MGTVYPRGSKLWFKVKLPNGAWKPMPSGLDVGREAEARALMEQTQRMVDEGGAPESALGPLTVRAYVKLWTADRRKRGVGSADDDEARLRLHVLPKIGSMLLQDVRPKHIRALVRDLTAKCGTEKDDYAPRTIRKIYGALHTLFAHAEADELVTRNPCVLKRGELPANEDKDPEWRAEAVFEKDEVLKLVFDPAVPEDRRVYYAIAFFTGLRTGEVFGLRWRDYEPDKKPLGRLKLSRSYSTKLKKEKSVKTKRPRQIPVHPALAKILREWREGGFQRMLGRSPIDDDLIIPSRRGKNRSTNQSLHKFYKDLDKLGLRRRRQYDSRRTLISIAQGDGADPNKLHWITHGAKGNIIDLYTTLPWEALCAEIAKLKLDPPPQLAPPAPAINEKPSTPPSGGSGADQPNGESPPGQTDG